MKQLVSILLFIVLISSSLKAQSWGNWIDVGYGIQISFKFGKKPCEFANTLARLRNTSQHKYNFVRVSFKSNCSGASEMAINGSQMKPGDVEESPGDWYSTSLAVSNIKLIRLEDENYKSLLGNKTGTTTNSSNNQNNFNSSENQPSLENQKNLEQDYEAKINEANTYFNNKSYSEARTAYEMAQSLFPNGKYRNFIANKIGETNRLLAQQKQSDENTKKLDEINKNTANNQLQQEKGQTAMNTYINDMSSLADQSVGEGQLNGEFIFNFGYGYFNLGESYPHGESSGSCYSFESEITLIKPNGLFWKFKGSYTGGTATTVTEGEDVMDLDLYRFGVAWGSAGDGLSATLEAEYSLYRLSSPELIRNSYSENALAFLLSPYYGIGMREKDLSMKIGGTIKLFTTLEDTEFGVGFGGYFEAKFNMFSLKLSYTYDGVFGKLNNVSLFSVAAGLRIPW